MSQLIFDAHIDGTAFRKIRKVQISDNSPFFAGQTITVGAVAGEVLKVLTNGRVEFFLNSEVLLANGQVLESSAGNRSFTVVEDPDLSTITAGDYLFFDRRLEILRVPVSFTNNGFTLSGAPGGRQRVIIQTSYTSEMNLALLEPGDAYLNMPAKTGLAGVSAKLKEFRRRYFSISVPDQSAGFVFRDIHPALERPLRLISMTGRALTGSCVVRVYIADNSGALVPTPDTTGSTTTTFSSFKIVRFSNQSIPIEGRWFVETEDGFTDLLLTFECEEEI